MSRPALKRIEMIFQTEVKIYKYPFPGLSHFSVQIPKQLIEFCSPVPNCLQSLNSVDFMRVGRVPRSANSNLKLVYLSILIMAYDKNGQTLLRRIKSFAYDETLRLDGFQKSSIPE